MTDVYGGSLGLSEADRENVVSFLLGGQTIDTGRDNGIRNYTDFSPALLRRLAENFPGDPCGFQRLAVLSAVSTLAPPAVANSCIITIEAQPVRITFDGTRPTATIGHLYAAGTALQVSGTASIVGVQALENVAGGILQVSYFT